MSSYLWQHYLENDLESFERLLDYGDSAYHQKASSSRSKPQQLKSAPGTSPHSGSPVAKHKGTPQKEFQFTNPNVARQAIREFDSLGRSILHLAASDSSKLGFLKALLRLPSVDILQQDLESGWTPLHRALYNGNISAAREIISYARRNGIAWDGLLRKDHSGDTPLELFLASSGGFQSFSPATAGGDQYEDSDDERDSVDGSHHADEDDVPESELFMFGSNKNLTLGFGDEDDRQFPELLTLPRQKQFYRHRDTWRRSYTKGGFSKDRDGQENALTVFNPVRIIDIQVGKFHSAIITDDPYDNLFVCGYGVGGRLGLGDNIRTQFTFKSVQGIGESRERVIAVALGQDHTIALTNTGSVWTWGSNNVGQLGYVIKGIPGGSRKDENPESPTPKPVVAGLKREAIIGVAAGKTHSVAYTRESIFLWGKNGGQLGIVEGADGSGINIQTTPRKLAASFLGENTIRQVVASDRATSILLSSKEVYVLKDFGYFKVIIPPPAPRNFGKPGSDAVFRSQIRPTYSQQVSRITGGSDSLALVSTIGDVSLLDFTKDGGSGQSRKGKPWANVRRVWDLRRRHMAVRDVGLDIAGNLIICTESGSVFRRLKKVRAKDGEVVVASTRGDDAKFVRVPGLNRVVSVRGSGFGAFAAVRQDSEIMKKLDIRAAELPNILDRAIKAWPTLKGKPAPSSRGQEDEINLMSTTSVTGLEGADVVKIGNLTLPVFRYILAGRVPLFRKMFHEALSKGSSSLKNLLTITRTANSSLEIEFFGVSKVSVLRFLCILYGKAYTEEWFGAKLLAGDIIASSLEVPELQESSWRDRRTVFVHDISNALEDPTYSSLGDTIIDLAGGSSIKAFSEILRLRSPYFDTLFGGMSDGFWIQGRLEEARAKKERYIHVDMKHIRPEVFKVILLHIYTDRSDDLFAAIKCWTFEEFLDFVLEVLAAANELMLDRLADISQCVLGSYVNIRNASMLLNSLNGSKVSMFHDQCLRYIIQNLDIMLENQLLDDLEDDLLSELDTSVKDLQARVSPASTGVEQLGRLLEVYPNLFHRSELELKQRIQAFKDEANRKRKEESLKVSNSDDTPPSRLLQPNAPSKISKKQRMADLMFDMDDDSKDAPVPETPTEDPIVDNHWEPVPVKTSKSKQKQKAAFEESPPRQEFWLRKGSLTPPMHIPLPPVEQSPVAKKGWSIPFAPSPKVDLKGVLDASSPTSRRRSNISLGLQGDSRSPAPPLFATRGDTKKPLGLEGAASTPPKPSPKPNWQPVEFGQPGPSLPPLNSPLPSAKNSLLPLPSNSPSPAPWKAPTPGQKISLKEILDSSAHPAPSSSRRPSEPKAKADSSSYASSAVKKLKPQPQASPSPAPELYLSMADIIAQQAAEKDIIEAKAAKRSLEEIQQEQEFQEWWNKEAERVRLEAEAQANRGKRSRGGRGGRNARGGGDNTSKGEKGVPRVAGKDPAGRNSDESSKPGKADKGAPKPARSETTGGPGEASSRGGRGDRGGKGGRGAGKGGGRGRGRGDGGKASTTPGAERNPTTGATKAQ